MKTFHFLKKKKAKDKFEFKKIQAQVRDRNFIYITASKTSNLLLTYLQTGGSARGLREEWTPLREILPLLGGERVRAATTGSRQHV